MALKYRVNKRLQHYLSRAGLVHGVCDDCVLPKALRDPHGLDFLTEAACAELAQQRLAIIDGGFTDSVMLQMRAEMQALRTAKFMQNDRDDVCNPDQVSRYMPFMEGAGRRDFEHTCPVTLEVVRRISALPWVLEENLGLRLAVPQTVMLACYPPHASYKMHLDSYAVQGGHQDVPRKVTVLLYCNVGWSEKVGGKLRTWAPFDQGKGAAQEISPVAGRIVAFMSEEIWHEVTEAHEDRYAMTLWVHDRDRVPLVQ